MVAGVAAPQTTGPRPGEVAVSVLIGPVLFLAGFICALFGLLALVLVGMWTINRLHQFLFEPGKSREKHCWE